MKTWHVVKFANENSVEVVPSGWYLKQTSECFWPPPLYRKDKILKLIENCVDAMQDWEIFRVKLLGTYDSFKVANKKAARATVTSDLSTNADKLLSSKRKRRKNPKFVESDSASPSSEDDNSYPNLKKGAFPTRRSRSYSPGMTEKQSVNTSMMFCSEDNLCAKVAATQRKQADFALRTPDIQKVCTKVAAIIPRDQSFFALSTPEIINHINEIESDFDKVDKNDETNPSSATGLFTKNGNKIHSNENVGNPSSQNETSIGTFINDNDFKKLVIGELSSIQIKLQHMMSEVSVLVQLQRQTGTCTKTEYGIKLNTLNSKCPLTTIEDLRKFEEWIEDKENYKITITEFQRIGGQNYAQTTRKIMYKMISNEVAIMFSWDGLKKKASFKSLKLAKAILEAMKIHYMEVSESNIIDVIKTFLVKAKERINLGKKNKALADEIEKTV